MSKGGHSASFIYGYYIIIFKYYKKLLFNLNLYKWCGIIIAYAITYVDFLLISRLSLKGSEKINEGDKFMNCLIVVAHPDDEVLGAGATIHKLVCEGHKVAVCTMANHASARANISATLTEDQEYATSILGVSKCYAADFPNIRMNTVPHLELVQFIEKCIEDFGADTIITHHPSDTNNDHVMTSYAAQAASRLFQRKDGIPALKLFLYMEVLSSTEWSLDSSVNRFTPNYFVEVGHEGIDIKLQALSAYKGVMRDYPHPRSEEAIRGLAAYRGVQAGCNYAEVFECVFWRN